MTHAQWYADINRCLRLSDTRPRTAIRMLRKLASTVESQSHITVSDWQYEQTLGSLSIVQSKIGEHKAAARSLQVLSEHHAGSEVYHRRAFVSTLASAAIELAKVGDWQGAARALRKASYWGKSLRPGERLLQQARKAIRTLRPRMVRRP